MKRLTTNLILAGNVLIISALRALSADAPPDGLVSQIDKEFQDELQRMPAAYKQSLSENLNQYEKQLSTDWQGALNRPADDFGSLARLHYALQFVYGGKKSFDPQDAWVVFQPISDANLLPITDKATVENTVALAWFQQASALCHNNPDVLKRYAYDADTGALKYAKWINYSELSLGNLENEIFVLSFLKLHSISDQPRSWSRQRKFDDKEWNVGLTGGIPINQAEASDVAGQVQNYLYDLYVNSLKANALFRSRQLQYLQSEVGLATQELIKELGSGSGGDGAKLASDSLKLAEASMSRTELDKLVTRMSKGDLAIDAPAKLDGAAEALESLDTTFLKAPDATESNPLARLQRLIGMAQVVNSITPETKANDEQEGINIFLAQLWLSSFKVVGQK